VTLIDNTITLRTILCVVFSYSFVTKLRAFDDFQDTVRSYEILPGSKTRFFAFIVLTGEAFVAILVGTGMQVAIGSVCAALLLLSFSLGITTNILRGRTSLDCGCFGLTSGRISWSHVATNIVLISVSIMLSLLSRQSVAIAKQPHDSAVLLASVSTGFVCLLIWKLLGTMTELSAKPVGKSAEGGKP
jgi:hypothetical protein